MAKRRRRGTTKPVTIPIRTLSGGVGRQAPSKRLPTEAENIDNAFVTLERSIEKRNGFQIIHRADTSVSNNLDVVNDDTKDFFPYWLQVSDRLRYLLLIDFKASSAGDQLFYVYRLTGSGLAEEEVSFEPTANQRAYFTWGSNLYTAKESLRIVNVGANIVVLNKNVMTGYTSGPEGRKYDFNGNLTTEIDTIGGPAIYQTTKKVDPEGIAEPFNKYAPYLSGDVFVYDLKVWELKVDRESVPEGGWIVGN